MLRCTCRRKNKVPEKRHLHVTAPVSLLGSHFQSDFDTMLKSLLPSSITLTGKANAYGSWVGYTLKPDTSTPNPSFFPSYDSLGLIYKTPDSIWGENACLFVQDNMKNLKAHFSDVDQGELGNCWVMATLTALAAYGNLSEGTSVIQQAFAPVSPAGTTNPSSVTVTLYNPDYNNFGRTSTSTSLTQTVTTQIPVKSSAPTLPVFVKSDAPGEYWPCMMEKALAAALTTTRNGETLVGYPALQGGSICVGMSLFTPGLPAFFTWDTKPTPADLYFAWNGLMAAGITVAVSWIANPVGGLIDEPQPVGYYGLMASHTYPVFSIVNVDGYQLALLRNPFGKGSCRYMQQSRNGEWTGAWSDCSPQWDANPTVKAACGFTGPRNDGLFWMDFGAICTYINGYEIFVPSSADLRAKDLRLTPFPSSLPPPPPPVGTVEVTFVTKTVESGYCTFWTVTGPGINFTTPEDSFYDDFKTYTNVMQLLPGEYSIFAWSTDHYAGWGAGTLEVMMGNTTLMGPRTINYGSHPWADWTFSVPAPLAYQKTLIGVAPPGYKLATMAQCKADLVKCQALADTGGAYALCTLADGRVAGNGYGYKIEAGNYPNQSCAIITPA